ncbi:MAG: ribosome silencing factor [Spirochaetota bacterium]
MAGTVNRKETLLDLAKLIESHKGIDTLVLYIGMQSTWTDYFLITTVTSSTHMKGLFRHIRDFLSEKKIEPLHKQKHVADDNWVLLDCGDFLVHLMTKETREFYELERLWYAGDVIYQSSKSSKSRPSSYS